MKPSIHMKTGLTAMAAAALAAGCCGPDGDRRSALSPSPGTTTYYSDTSNTRLPATTSTAAESTQTERTRVRETTSAEATAQDQYSLPLYSESLKVGKREVENGSVRLRKVVRTENASQPIELRRETVVIDREAFDQARRAADAGQPGDFGAQFQEKEIVIDLKREEPVVEVQPFVSGRIIARKNAQTDQQNVQRQVRREEVEILKSGNDQDITITERARNVRVEDIGAPGSRTEQTTGSSTEQQQQNNESLQNDSQTEPPSQQP
jgi:uncharacterized protein (TIGR02271 family)